MQMMLVIVGSSCSSSVSIESPTGEIVQTLLRADAFPRVGPDVWETFICRIPENYDDNLYDMSGVRLSESVEWVTAQLEPVTGYFERWSNGRYVAEFRVGGEVLVDFGGAEECVDAALDRSASEVDGVLVVADAQHRENRVGGWGRGGHRCGLPCSARESKRAVYLGAADFVSGSPIVLDLVEHEVGHALEWPHSFRFEPYDSGIDVMSDSAAARRADGERLHAPGVLAINRYLSGWMERDPFVVDAGAGGVVEIDAERFAVVSSGSARAISIEVIDENIDLQHLAVGGIAVHLIDWGSRSCENPEEVNGFSGQFCLGASRSQRLMGPEASRDGLMRTGDRVEVDGVTIVVESIETEAGSVTARVRWERN